VELALRINRGNALARRKMNELHAPAAEEHVAGQQKGVGPLGGKPCEGCIDLTAGASFEHAGLETEVEAAVATSLSVDFVSSFI
jgi:hypothetical protein